MSGEIAVVEMPPAELMVYHREQFHAMKSSLASGETMKIGNKPYIKRNGWRMIAAGFNVNLELVKDNEGKVLHTRIEGEDDIGKFYVHTYVARATLPNGKYAECEGACSSRDSFFGKAHGQWKPLSEIDEADIIATAQTVAYNRAISDLVGGAEVSAEEMMGKESVSFKKPPPSPEPETAITDEVIAELEGEVIEHPPDDTIPAPHPEMSEVEADKAGIKEMLTEMAAHEGRNFSDLLVEFTEFEVKSGADAGKMVGGKKDLKYLSDKATPVTFQRVSKAYKDMRNA